MNCLNCIHENKEEKKIHKLGNLIILDFFLIPLIVKTLTKLNEKLNINDYYGKTLLI